MQVLNLPKYHKQRVAAISCQEKDYSRYGFRKDFGKLRGEDAEVILILLTVAQIIDCQTVKGQIKDAIAHNELKDFVLIDILTECDETFFSKETKSKTYKNIVRMDEKDLVDAFIEIANQINY